MALLTLILKITSTRILPKSIDDSCFLNHEVKLAFSHLRYTFAKASILHNFNPKRYIQFEINVSGYAIDTILSQLTPESG